MLRNLSTVLVVLGLLLAAPSPAQAQYPQRAYAPENLRSLSRQDQERVIQMEYSEQAGNRRIPADQLRFYLDQVSRSNWSFSRIRQDIATSLGGNGNWNAGNGLGNGASVQCESDNGRRRECRSGFRGRAVLTQNISQTRCVEGQNWGSGNGTIWVDGGCKGRFSEGASAGGNGTVRCESKDGRRRECTTGFRGNAVISRQLSSTRCVEGQNWGQQRGMLWVGGGCRADFVQGNSYGNWNPGNWNPGRGNANGNNDYNITCSSDGGRRNTCAWNHRSRPALIQRLSTDACREGSTWGYSGAQIWVDRGCRARFGVR